MCLNKFWISWSSEDNFYCKFGGLAKTCWCGFSLILAYKRLLKATMYIVEGGLFMYKVRMVISKLSSLALVSNSAAKTLWFTSLDLPIYRLHVSGLMQWAWGKAYLSKCEDIGNCMLSIRPQFWEDIVMYFVGLCHESLLPETCWQPTIAVTNLFKKIRVSYVC